MYFSRDSIVRSLRTSRERYKRLMEPFFEFEDGNLGYSRSRKQAKAYRLRPREIAAKDRRLPQASALPVMLDGRHISACEFPRNGVPAQLDDHLFIPAIVELPIGRVHSAIEVIEREIALRGGDAPLRVNRPGGATLLHAQQLRLCAIGGLPNLYLLQDNGRLGPSGSVLVITLPSQVRRLLFADSGLVDYEFASCHFTIFLSLADGLGFSADTVRDYASNKDRWHDRWSEVAGSVSPSAIKQIALSLLTGGSLSPSKQTEVGSY